jgi:hypothetical protein
VGFTGISLPSWHVSASAVIIDVLFAVPQGSKVLASVKTTTTQQSCCVPTRPSINHTLFPNA